MPEGSSTITDADRALASELGLFFVRGNVEHPETWLVKSVLTRRTVGRLLFGETSCIYVTKTAANLHGIEETVADALRWIAPLVRHARTGLHEGTEVIIPRFGSIHERPRALTECGAKSSAADYGPTAARSALINGQSREMCSACRRILEARETTDASLLPDEPSSATRRQRAYVRRLIDEGAHAGRRDLVDARVLERLSCRGASALIDALVALRERDWKGGL